MVTIKYLVFFIWISYILGSSLYLFCKGFMISRQILETKSSCDKESGSLVEEFLSAKGITELKQADSRLINSDLNSLRLCRDSEIKIIVIIIDGLRYDFTDHLLSNEPYRHYINKLPIISKMLVSHPNRTKHYKLIADPPTTTFQRLNGITTGSLPTFIDVGSNFASYAITEDNIIDQAINHNKKIVFMGDDTWMSLFPDKFYRSYPFPSFNVWDLDTVDNGVRKHLFQELGKSDWDVIVAHFLGVDHCGHRYGPNHPEMGRKLKEMNEIIERVVEDLPQDGVLMVLGDHGMTETGDHGGDSEGEVTSALFVHAARELLREETRDPVQQVDLVPTLATLLGVPIPFASLGTLVPGLLPALSGTFDPNSPLSRLAFWSNVKQVTKFIKDYSASNSQLPPVLTRDLQARFNKLFTKYSGAVTHSETLASIAEASLYIGQARELCRSVWVQFDTTSMTRGLLLFSFALVLTFIFIDGLTADNFEDLIVNGNFLLFIVIALELLVGLALGLYELSLVGDRLHSILLFTGAASIFILSAAIGINWPIIVDNWRQPSYDRTMFYFCKISALLFAVGVLSNSFVVEECFVVSFLLVSNFAVLVLRTPFLGVKRFGRRLADWSGLLLKHARGQALLVAGVAALLVRGSRLFWTCREEQSPWCLSPKLPPTSSNSLFTIILISMWITLLRSLLRTTGNLSGLSPTVLVSRYVPIISLVSAGAFWVIKNTPQSNMLVPWQIYVFSRVIFGMCLASLVWTVVFPLSICFVGGGAPVVYGLATSYSAPFLSLSMLATVLGALLLGEQRALSLLLMQGCMFATALLLSLWRHARSTALASLFQTPWPLAVLWTLSCHYWFFGTGHQPSFLNLHWDSAVLFGDITSTLVPGLLVGANTFLSHILHGLFLPGLLVLPFSLELLWPAAAQLKAGELVLHQNVACRRHGLLSLALKYLLIHSLRVLLSMFSATIHARHLMVWKIFAPKLVFEAVGLLITMMSTLVGCIIVERVSKQIDDFLKMIESDKATGSQK